LAKLTGLSRNTIEAARKGNRIRKATALKISEAVRLLKGA
jgi:hypothetical protein